MPIESFLEYIRYEKNLSTHTVLSYGWLFCRKEECRLVVFAVKFLL